MSKVKKYLLDTNVLIYDTDSIYGFGNAEIIISDVTLNELDSFKVEKSTERGFYSREVTNKIKNLLNRDENANRNLLEGVVRNDKGGILRILKTETKSYLSADDRLVLDAKKEKATLVVRDNILFIKANGVIDVEEYKADKIKTNTLYKGYRSLRLSEEDYNKFANFGKISNKEFGLYPNEFALITMDDGEDEDYEEEEIDKDYLKYFNYGRTNLADFVGIMKNDTIYKVDLDKGLQSKYNGMVSRPKNLEQKLLMYLLLDEDIKLVTVSGSSGKGKTFLATDYVKNFTEKGYFNQYVYTKSIIDTDENESMGFLKGGLLEKLLPNLKPLNYSLEALSTAKKTSREDKLREEGKEVKNGKKTNGNGAMPMNTLSNIVEELDMMDNKYIIGEMQKGNLQILPLSKLRGVTIDKKGIILDEAQNVKRHMMKTFVSRLTDESKAIITGDNDQIDDHNLSKYNNGFTHLIENGKEQENIAHITLDINAETQRGKLAQFSNDFL